MKHSDLIQVADIISENENKAVEVISKSDYEVYGFAMRFILIFSSYLYGLSKQEEAGDLIKYYEALPPDFYIDWLFDGLKNMISECKLKEDEKKVLNILISLAAIRTDREKNN